MDSLSACDLGLIGLGVMGRNFVLNLADHGFAIAGYDQDLNKVRDLCDEAGERKIYGADSLSEFINRLRTPRAVMMLVPAGAPVDKVIRDLLPHLARGDLIIDGGNSFFKDTDLRSQALANRGLAYVGMGISGGEHGARHGPSLMPGGAPEAYERVRTMFETSAAQVAGETCIAYLGPGSAGHYVKMVHNGIEYGLMQLIAETYDLLKRGVYFTDDELYDLYRRWNASELNAYLIEITASIFREVDPQTGERLIDVILDEAKQKGTGSWTSQDALSLHVPIPTIDAAVAARNLSMLKSERETASQLLMNHLPRRRIGRHTLVRQLRNALYAGMIITYAQGFALLQRASPAYHYGLRLEEVARIWRGGCIIRSDLLEKIRAAYQAQSELPNLLCDRQLSHELNQRQADLRAVVRAAATFGLPVPGFMASLAYLDGYRSEWLPANLIQAQRDYFGAHTYERMDAPGVFHTSWSEE